MEARRRGSRRSRTRSGVTGCCGRSDIRDSWPRTDWTRMNAMNLCPQAGQDAAHVAEASLHAVHGVIFVDLVFEHYAALVVHLLQLAEDRGEGHDAIAAGNLRFFLAEVGQILDVHVVQARSGFADRRDYVDAGARRVSDIDAKTAAGVHILDDGEHA